MVSGTVNANVSVSRGDLIPGSGTAGKLTINGNLSLEDDSNFDVLIGGSSQGTGYGYVQVNGTVGISVGQQLTRLLLYMRNGFELQLKPDQIFTILTANGVIMGSFFNVANGGRLETTDGLASFQVNYGPDSIYDPDEIVLSDPISNAVPEPTCGILLVAGAALIGLVRFRRA